MHQSEKTSWIGMVFWTPICLGNTAVKPIELAEEPKWENELFLSTVEEVSIVSNSGKVMNVCVC